MSLTSLFGRAYQSLVAHTVVQAAVLALLLAVYLVAKAHWRGDYQQAAQDGYRSVAATYGVSVESATGLLRLVEPPAGGPVAVGADRVSALAAVVEQTRREVDRLNAAGQELYRQRVVAWAAGDAIDLHVPLTVVGGGAGLLRVPAPDLIADAGRCGPGGLDRLVATLTQTSQATLQTPPAPADTPAVVPTAITGIEVRPERLLADLRQQRQRLADERPWTCTDPDGVARRLRGEWYAQLRSSEAPQDLPAGTRLVDALARQTEQRLQDRLVKALVGDQGWFWLVGCWRWLEVVSWCIFGVLAHSLLHLGNFLMGWTGGGVWTPRQGWYTAVKMLHVPLMSLAVFWIFAYATGEDGPLDLVRSNPALIAYAFIFGLFPTLAYDALRKVTENLRKALDSRAATADPQAVREVAVPAGQPPAPGKPPQFGQLRERLGRIATAPLE